MPTPVVYALGILLVLWAVPGRADGVSFVLLTLASHTAQVGAGVAASGRPNTTQCSAVVPDTEGETTLQNHFIDSAG
ncbi:hypothetical protein [Hymenobacter norwichensis]|uniref:hypothetical protein n=1 Tax=Hymenobacter norwichensis TaxID=223903 RepID=UPI0003B3D7AF|nr:hypothetical protein [Hymenobacter norwichensis]